MVARWMLCAALLLSLSTPAHALCRDDLKELQPRIDRLKKASPARYGLAIQWLGRAQEAEPGSEVECLNFAARARRALIEQIQEAADCLGANASLAQCRGGGGGVQAVTATAAGLGGDGGFGGVNGTINASAGMVGSVGQTNHGQEATGTDR